MRSTGLLPPLPKTKQSSNLHETLAAFNHVRMTPHSDTREWEAQLADEYAMRMAEGRFVEAERARVCWWAGSAPQEPAAFVEWFEELEVTGPGQRDPLFPWLAEHASREQMRWFLRQEISGEAGFDDLVALTQVKLATQAKLELARNYWDEMGQGHQGGMHGPLLDRLGVELDIGNDGDGAGAAAVVEESLNLGNLMLALATNRRYAYQSIGALGAIELTAPGRAEKVNAGLKRLGVGGAARSYFALHATLDRKHAAAWSREVLFSLVAEDPKVAQPIAEGALLRLNAGARCFERYRRELGLSPGAATAS